MSFDLTYPILLREEFLARVKRNPAFSLRAFARDLNISPGFLSQVLNDKKTLSEEKAFHISSRLKWDSKKKKLFINLVKLNLTKDVNFKQHIVEEIQTSSANRNTFHDLKLDEFKLISEWYHYAILELTQVKSLKLSPETVASRLGIHHYEARAGIDRLLRLGLLEVSNGSFVKTKSSYQIKDVLSSALQNFHKQMLVKADQGLSQPLENREYVSLTVAINPEKIQKAKALIRQFSLDIMNCLEEGPQSQVYQIGIQMFRIDKEKV